MGRRKTSDEQGVSMDSLMDALTNVVAVLIVILILLQLDVKNTVEKFFDDLTPATPGEIAAAKEQKNELAAQLVRQQDLFKAPKPTEHEIAAIRADLSLLEKSIEDNKTALLELSELRKKVDAEKKVETAEQKKTEVILAEISRIKALLDQTPVPKAPEPTVVKIPNSREIPDSAVIFYIHTFKEQIHLIDSQQARTMVLDEFKFNDRNWFRELKRIPNKPDVRVYDQEKIVQHFEKKNLKVRKQSISVPYNKPWNRLNFRVTFDSEQGDATLSDLDEPKGRFHNICDYIKRTPRSVVIFKVHPNSFATYIKAREIADQMLVPCGWEIDTNNFYQERLEFTVNNLEQPPPPKPGGQPTPPAAPSRKLD
ncbi:MAG: hypothetical protein ACKO2G_11475 [Verrucomicrobiales bacterium]